jgi:hypothetical protein
MRKEPDIVRNLALISSGNAPTKRRLELMVGNLTAQQEDANVECESCKGRKETLAHLALYCAAGDEQRNIVLGSHAQFRQNAKAIKPAEVQLDDGTWQREEHENQGLRWATYKEKDVENGMEIIESAFWNILGRLKAQEHQSQKLKEVARRTDASESQPHTAWALPEALQNVIAATFGLDECRYTNCLNTSIVFPTVYTLQADEKEELNGVEYDANSTAYRNPLINPPFVLEEYENMEEKRTEAMERKYFRAIVVAPEHPNIKAMEKEIAELL